MDYPRTVDEIFHDYEKRREGILKALTDDVDEFFSQADPDRENLCLYGQRDGTWTLDLPADEVPSELPEPSLGLNFARDGMQKREWLSLVAVHSDAWLIAVAFFYGVKLDALGRARLFAQINSLPTLFEVISKQYGKKIPPIMQNVAPTSVPPAKKKKIERPTESSAPSGRPLRADDLTPLLKGRQAELFWPDNKLWYLVEIIAYNPKVKQAKIVYASGEEEDLEMDEILREGHMHLL
uniref:Alfin N-terminal domain-containing protein n=1 Tax=Polytomella parva TaxID=51329 RepID=A0A7S0YAB0_9CHLO|mmetsp:Transcript_12961/g.23058  ORF Transcript_12961/g.23058 Transcript_12961/m.23058 type:complete len:238 (+) Transcript_12961:152-865(+)|eukprot:CAMPEP_0175055860 /NCGR_PEP_ID=MMETSP0052_2-20121109/10327_1 /TAXON_ID=51329 ORGANISM="Polytomella parva, Strain SAG 63-3" /NCGR_SAMPLE_ID=MMETSP0052_2 /ASSEMBLY_ACC=CAM_ASM_000194 /LENGTH=237 /DNA_ID=CAMNT_0016320777 /DNA_START=92 /DNA_END=805 /DNA_ORIENTATION=+